MTPTTFPEANASFKAPSDLHESQVRTVCAYCGPIASGSMDGEKLVVVAWMPSEEELAALNSGCPIFLTTLGGLPPHFLSTDFATATNPSRPRAD